MSVSKTGWIIAAATAAAFAAGCAGQSHNNDNAGASCAGEPAVAATHSCKGMAECKSRAGCTTAKVRHHHHHAKKVRDENANRGADNKAADKAEDNADASKDENNEAK